MIESPTTAQQVIDGRGKTITTHVVYAATKQLEDMAGGEVLEVITDDFEPFEPDIAAWCAATGHRLLTSEKTEHGLRFLIEKGAPTAKKTSLAMVISDGGLEELLSPLGFALAAALEGIDVHLFFQGPAVRTLARGHQPKLKGWTRRPFTRFAASGMAEAGHVPAQEKLRQLRSLGAQIYMCGPSMDQFKVAKEELIFDDLPLVEYLTFMTFMEDADIHLYI